MRLFEFLRRLAPAGLAACLLAGLAGCAQPQRQSVSWFDVFDTVTILQGYTTSEEEFSQQAAALKADLTEYHQLYDIYNSYPDMNNLKTVNDNAGVAPVQVDQKIIDLVKLGKEMYELTDGRVNIAMGSVLSLWHDAREAGLANPKSAALPDMEALEEAAAHTDIDQVILDEEAGTIYLADPEMRLDVGSLGKGYAVEMVCQAAQARGLESALLSVGGNLRAIGEKPEGPWAGGVENPWDSEAGSLFTVELTDCALVTSGDYQRYYTVDGKQYHHIIDPATLMPATYFDSVTVRCPDSGMADGLSTALFNMPLEEGLELVESLENVEAAWMLPDGSTRTSSGFSQWCR